MCYATSLRKEKDEIIDRIFDKIPAEFAIDLEYQPYFHLNGFTNGNLYIIKMDEPDWIYPASWGLVPEWAAHDPVAFRKKANTLNAKSEAMFETASFKDSADDKRCLILSDGFYEPHHKNGVSYPHFCYQPTKDCPEGDLFMFAGLYTELDDELFTATILTTEANDFFAEIHNQKKRMPLVLADDLFEDWLDDGMTQSQINELMAWGFTSNEFKAHAVSRDIYKKGINANQSYIVEPVLYDDLNTLF